MSKFRVKPRGAGIEDHHLSRIFDPYFTTRPGAPSFGFATVHSIIQQHHGHITVTSTVGIGTTFTVCVPSSYSPSEPGLPRTPVIPEKGRGRVLVLDDEPSICRMVADALTHFGHEVVTVQDRLAGIDRISRLLSDENPFDVVILDLTIPCAMGWKEAIQHLRRIDPDIKAIVANGFQGILVKPYKIFDLANLLESIGGPVHHDRIQ